MEHLQSMAAMSLSFADKTNKPTNIRLKYLDFLSSYGTNFYFTQNYHKLETVNCKMLSERFLTKSYCMQKTATGNGNQVIITKRKKKPKVLLPHLA